MTSPMKPPPAAENQWDSSTRALNEALESVELDKAAQAVMDMLWYVAAIRPDYEDLPALLAGSTAEMLNTVESGDWVEMVRLATGIVEKTTHLYGTEDEPMTLRDHCLAVMTAAKDCDYAGIGQTIGRCLGRLLNLGNGVPLLPVVIEDNQIRIGRHTRVSFHRTLRVPEDGKQYPLPAGFGEFPILRVADYADKVPPQWLEDGGFFIPLYQREALFLEFEGEEWRPSILKVAVGGVSAITGEADDENIRLHKQDYVVIPDQKWLDGINSGDGTVGQFVAMPLGQGYTIEEQLTDEAKFGGFQLVAFEPRDGRFPDEDPDETARRREREKERLIRAAQQRVAANMTDLQRTFMERILNGGWPEHIARSLGLDPGTGLRILSEIKTILKAELGEVGIVGLDRSESSSALYSRNICSQDISAWSKEMGIARGGSIKQQIHEDTYGVHSWDKDKKGRVSIHIVNSELFEAITGSKPPETPITIEEYQAFGIPWFDAYDEHARGLMAAKKFQNVKGVSAIDRMKGVKIGEATKPIEISPELIRRIKPPTREEYIARLAKRADSSWQAGQWLIAHRESSCLLDLDKQHTLALQIRADCNIRLGRYQDAACDASECLAQLPESVFALTRRAQAELKLGEPEMALADAEAALQAQPSTRTGLRVRSEALFVLKRFEEAVEDITKLLELSPGECPALRIRAECHRRLGLPMAAVQDASKALALGDTDIATLLTRAAAHLDCDNPDDARRDAEAALRREPRNQAARLLLLEIINYRLA